MAAVGEVLEDGLGVVGDARRRGDLLVAEADRGGSQREWVACRQAVASTVR
jgi:hypothetical protein